MLFFFLILHYVSGTSLELKHSIMFSLPCKCCLQSKHLFVLLCNFVIIIRKLLASYNGLSLQFCCCVWKLSVKWFTHIVHGTHKLPNDVHTMRMIYQRPMDKKLAIHLERTLYTHGMCGVWKLIPVHFSKSYFAVYNINFNSSNEYTYNECRY